MVHRAEDGPVGYMVLGSSCEVQLMVGDGQTKRTTKAGAQRRAEVLMAHGDALITAAPKQGDQPIEASRIIYQLVLTLILARNSKQVDLSVPAQTPLESVSAMEGVVYYAADSSTLEPPAPAPKTKARKRKSRA
ncbi:hypothetical protein FRC07_013479 [Ceratobasidium sp. 392]|nr:hypothetical protein FRC07_013479 [Ceratobasidium sp. 392]